MTDRLTIIDQLNILDSAPEPEFDNIAIAAKALCDTPVALISLVHDKRQWFKARIGFAPHETPLAQSVCVYALASRDVLVIPDLATDPRTRMNTLVTATPMIRFYAGAPIIVDGVAIGSLCTIDTKPRPEGITQAQSEGLQALASQVASQLLNRAREQVLLAETQEQNRSLDQALRRSAALSRFVDALQETEDVAELLRRASEIMASVISSTRAGFGLVDATRETVEMQPEWLAPGAASVAGSHNFRDYGSFLDDLKRGDVVIIGDVAQDPRTSASAATFLSIGIRLLINVPVIQAGKFTAVGFVHSDRRQDLSDEDISFIRTIADRVQAAIQHKRNLDARELLNRELLHRVKNTLAVVGAIARQTLPNSDGAVDIFLQRLRAIADANDLLMQRDWAESELGALIRKASSMMADQARIAISGPPVLVGSQSAVMISLLIHELLTNSMKYGALGVPEGRISINWTLEEGADQTLRLHWTEENGPAVTAPSHTGFGSRLIEMGLSGNGNADVSYSATGLIACFSATASELGN